LATYYGTNSGRTLWWKEEGTPKIQGINEKEKSGIMPPDGPAREIGAL